MNDAFRLRRPLTAAGTVALWLLASFGAHAGPAANPLGLEVHHATASAVDVDRAVRWYTTMLGFTVRERGVRQNDAFEFAELSIPGFGVALVHIRSSAPAAPRPTTAPPAIGWMHIVFSVADPDETYRALKEKGADLWLRPQAPPGPVTTFLMHDSEGNEIEIVGRPAAAKP